MDISEFHFYSRGVAAENLKRGSYILEVSPIEVLNMQDGELTDEAVQMSSSVRDVDGSSTTVSAYSTRSISANWLPLGLSNRITAPDVRRGERLMIYRFADTDNFYWTTAENDIRLRCLETAVFAFSGTQEETKEVSPENYYFLEFSTHDKKVTFSTSQKNGEACTYTLQFNTGTGEFVVEDSIGNHVYLNSPDHLIRLKNASDCQFELNKEDLNGMVPGNTTITTQGNTSIVTKGNTDVTTTGNTTVSTEGNTAVNTTGNTSVITKGNNTIEGLANLIKGPTTILGTLTVSAADGGTGSVKMKANIELEGDIVQEGSQNVMGGISAQGAITSSTSMSAPQGNFPNLD